MTTSSVSRQSLLDRQAAVEGQTWAREMRSSIHEQSRRATGGWPGTITEARARLVEFVLPRLARDGGSAATSEALQQATRVLYASARTAWLAQCAREDSL
jgi:hypothetical protein